MGWCSTFSPVTQLGLRSRPPRAAGRPISGPWRGGLACMVFFCKRVAALNANRNAQAPYCHRLNLCTKHPERSLLHHGAVHDAPRHDGAAADDIGASAEQRSPAIPKPEGRSPPTDSVGTIGSGRALGNALRCPATESG